MGKRKCKRTTLKKHKKKISKIKKARERSKKGGAFFTLPAAVTAGLAASKAIAVKAGIMAGKAIASSVASAAVGTLGATIKSAAASKRRGYRLTPMNYMPPPRYQW